MDDHLFTILKIEVLYNCELGLAGGRMLEEARQEAVEGRGIRAEDSMWFALQGILSVGANVAKLLWGSQGPAVEEERSDLRRVAGVDDSSPLKLRNVRNHFEHHDEKLIKWFKAGDTDVYSSRQIGRDDGWPPENARFGHYDPQTRIVTFLGHTVSIADLLGEFERIHGNLRPQ
jgi:hypothetical protein